MKKNKANPHRYSSIIVHYVDMPCGSKSPYQSLIKTTEDKKKVTCKNCLKIMKIQETK